MGRLIAANLIQLRSIGACLIVLPTLFLEVALNVKF